MLIDFLLSYLVQKANRDINPWAGVTKGAEETEGDRWRGRRLHNSVSSATEADRINWSCEEEASAQWFGNSNASHIIVEPHLLQVFWICAAV